MIREFIVGHAVSRRVSLNRRNMNGIAICKSVRVHIGDRVALRGEGNLVVFRFPLAPLYIQKLSPFGILEERNFELAMR